MSSRVRTGSIAAIDLTWNWTEKFIRMTGKLSNEVRGVLEMNEGLETKTLFEHFQR